MRGITYILAIYLSILLSSFGHNDVAGVEREQVNKIAEPGLTWQFAYDDAGRVTKAIDSAGRQTKVRYEFDNNKRVQSVAKELSDGSKVTYKFDRFGRRKSMTDTSGNVHYKYDGFGRLTEVHRDGQTTISYTYDTMDRLKSVSVGKGLTTSYSYDFLGRLDRVETPAGDISYQYQAGQMKIIRTLPNGVWTVWESQPDDKLKSITHVDGSNHVISKFEYVYRPDGLVSGIKEWDPQGGKIVRYEYDKVQRLIGVEDSRRGKVEYGYDNLGNRTELKAGGKQPVASTYDWAGRMLSYNNQACSHDDSGNLTSYGGSKGRGVFEFDHMNLLKSVKHNGTSIEYSYDGDGYLIARTAGGKRTSFVPDPLTDNWSPLLAVDAAGKKTFYVWAGGTPLAAVTGKDVKFFLHDHLGSVRCVLDKKGKVVTRSNYSPFGVPHHAFSDSELHPGFAGLFLDSQVSMYLTKARVYSPHLGRFLQIDPQHHIPFGSQKDLSLYAYCGGDPVNFTDRNGAEAVSINAHNVWWGAFWKDVGGHLFDARRAKDTLADYSDAHLKNARGSGVAAGLMASVLDVIGGYIPGEGGNRGQAYGSVMWSLALGGFSSGGNAITALKTIGYTRTANSAIINSFQGNYGLALLNTVSLGGAALSLRESGQLNRISDTIDVFGYYSSTYDTYKAGFAATDSFDAGKIWRGAFLEDIVSHNPLDIEFLGGQWLNFIGKGSYWIGANRGGNQFSWARDSLGRFPLGDTEVGITGKAGDRAAKWHDIQDYVNVHADKGQEVKVPWGGGQFKYFISRGGKSAKHNFEVFQFALSESLGLRTNYPISDSPTTSNPIELSALRERYPMVGRAAAISPSNVGGVYLRGAGESLKDLGLLSGIAIDEKNGRLVLLAEENQKIDLPPLRMDDVVTIFRSVYEYGEAPFVSIDPDPDDPKGPLMLTRHGKATQNTYVGWVLFEADRVMKAYSLGTDNITREKIESKIEGYQSLLEAGFSDSNETDSEPIWERFWIVPASVNQRESTEGKLTLFDVSLKVMTQRMVIKKGKLVPAPDDTPSPQAKAFAKWFTDNYDQLSDEAQSVPPEEVGVDVPVSFFWELRRVALITAIAECLRDQGVPMPQWMRNYKVKECSLDPTTPAITVEATRKEETFETRNDRTRLVTLTRTNRIYGGVNLAAADKNVHRQQGDAEADRLAPAVWRALSAAPSPLLTLVKFQDADKTYQAVAIPGDNTQDVGANQLTETDLVVPVLRGKKISLVRKYNSFFAPDDVFGTGWTLDLPRLEERRQPTGRTSDTVTYSIGYQLTSPLNTYSELFRIRKDGSGVESKSLLPEKQDVFSGVAEMNDKNIGRKTTVLLFQDGRQWHFDESGYLAAQVNNPSTVIYRRSKSHLITRVEGWYGKKLYADIKLSYDKQGRIVSAKSSNEANVEYEYGSSGELKKVAILSEKESDKQKPQKDIIGYEYTDGLITSVAWNGENTRRFEYGNRGQLISESRLNSKVVYKVNPGPEGVTVTSSTNGMSDSVEYDTAFRPVKQVFRHGTEVQWQYDDSGGREVAVKSPTGERYTLEYSADGKRASVRMPNGNIYSTTYDDAGRPVEHRLGNTPIVQQRWHANGLLASASYETFALHPEYRDDMVLAGVMFTPPGNATSFSEWAKVKYNEEGRPIEVTDCTGYEIKMGYDKQSRLSIINTKHGSVKITHDQEGRLERVQASWGYNQHNVYDSKTNELEKVELIHGKNNAVIEFDQGRLVRVRQYDEGEFILSYYGRGDHRGQVRQIRTPDNLDLAYEYDSDGRLAAVDCGRKYRFEYTFDNQGRLLELAQAPAKK